MKSGCTPEQLAWLEEMFILSCALYEAHEETVISDVDFDQDCVRLLRFYDELSPAFRLRVSRENLEAGTAMGLSFTQEELEAGREWRERVAQLKTERAASAR